MKVDPDKVRVVVESLAVLMFTREAALGLPRARDPL
jgi:hypothetical protein